MPTSKLIDGYRRFREIQIQPPGLRPARRRGSEPQGPMDRLFRLTRRTRAHHGRRSGRALRRPQHRQRRPAGELGGVRHRCCRRVRGHPSRRRPHRRLRPHPVRRYRGFGGRIRAGHPTGNHFMARARTTGGEQVLARGRRGRRSLAIIKTNVLLQFDNLRTYPCVADGERAGSLTIHGWLYDLHEGSIQPSPRIPAVGAHRPPRPAE